MAALATVDQLSNFLQSQPPLAEDAPDALLYLELASDMVRDFLQQQLDYVQNDVVVLTAYNGVLFLPEQPVTSVSLLETFDGTTWSTADPTTYTVALSTGVITATPCTGVQWPTDPGTWRVTYTHGFPTLPNSIVAAVLGVAARAYASPVSVDSERIGGYQVKYATLNEGFSAIERAGLARYIVPRIA